MVSLRLVSGSMYPSCRLFVAVHSHPSSGCHGMWGRYPIIALPCMERGHCVNCVDVTKGTARVAADRGWS